MASPGADIGQHHHPEAAPEPAFQEAQKWIEAVTGRRFGDKDFRSGLENGILLCELLSSIKPGLVKKINRLPTPIAGLDNLTLFLRGCEELGLKGSQLFDPGDLQDTSIRANLKGSDCSRKLKNVLITIYWLGKAANSCASYSGPTLDLKEFEGLLTQMRKEAEDSESPKRSVRDSGYVDCWDSERSDSLSPPRHGRDDSFDSLDSFGSRSQQTPSPDVVIRGSSDGRGSDSESDAPHRKLPDVRRDDMLARRTSCSEPRSVMPFNQYLPNKSNQSAYIPTPLRKKRAEPEECRKSWSTATSPIGGDRPFRFSHRASVSDDPESVSMIDMRCEEEVFLQPHSQVRHELMHNQYNRLREEEDHWQDDLARWKSRRRSISQDLIKKEEERKMMERLMSDDGSQSQRRKSIKTYREIVEEKERRERELHEAYRSAQTPEEAAAVLQRYAQRFTISEAVLERLHLPKLLERSVSVDPSAPPSPTRDPNPMRYLRQQSLPAPKFTATIEAMVGLPRSPSRAQNPDQSRARSPEHSPTRALPKAVPLLTPKPYTQPRTTLEGPKPAQVDGMTPVNGDAGEAFGPADDGGERGGEGEPSLMVFLPSPAVAATPESAAAVPTSPTRAPAEPVPVIPEQEESDAPKSAGVLLDAEPPVPPDEPAETHGLDDLEETGQEEATPTRPTSLPTELQEEGGVYEKAEPEAAEAEARVSPIDGPARPVGGETAAESSPLKEARDQPVEEQAAPCESSVVTEGNCVATAPVLTEVAMTLGHQHTDTSATETSIPSLESPQSVGDESPQTHTVTIRMEPPAPEGVEVDSAKPQLPAPVLSMAKRVDHWSWDPNEERRRQERWQQEQDRMLQEKYQREQEKLKQEWERAQKEVEEEERKYHEEERKILEETVAPLTPHVSALPSPGRRDAAPPTGPRDPMARSLAEWERKQEWLERQARGKDEDAEREERQRDDGGWSDAVRERTAAAREYHEVTESSRAQCFRQTEAIAQAQQNGQRSPQLQFLMAPSLNSKESQQQQEVWRKTASLDRNWSTQQTPPGGVKRSVSGKKLCSSCGHPLGKGAAMIIETLSLYFHIQCFKCGICKGQLGDTSTGTDVRIRSGLLNCHQCYLRSRSAGQPTTL
ncbi:LIM and calponin homology domains-containing protein 1-like isoform X3 [Megalops cyprinoides]|uniref:LIM and calponin homology domains-containing protein 1-like isoform X3 n=1 Tax=Megalops cyprinoides TaxID=118141 RepID=UPI0018646C22|nr:LIM and calponin homology domains-containing protein 1-like isoform X3 [Megalops cyprinoides]